MVFGINDVVFDMTRGMYVCHIEYTCTIQGQKSQGVTAPARGPILGPETEGPWEARAAALVVLEAMLWKQIVGIQIPSEI